MKRHPSTSFERLHHLDTHVISELRVLVVGLGRVGMSVLRQLMQLPICEVIGVDCDTVSAKERGSVFPAVVRESYKSRAAAEVLGHWNPAIGFHPALIKINADAKSRFRDLMDSADVLIWAADDWQALEHAVSWFYEVLPAVGIVMAEMGGYAEIAWSAPSQTPCLACSLRADQRTSEQGAGSLPSDVDAAAVVAVNVMLGLFLSGRKGGELFQHLLDPSHSLIVLQNRPTRFTESTNPRVPTLTRLVRVEAACVACRRRY